MPRTHCLIPDISGERVLAVPAGGGRWTLPSFEPEQDWFAYASTAIARWASAHFGIAMTALHERGAADCQVCELEIQARQWTPPADARWIAGNDLAATALEPAALSAVLRDWFAEQETGAVPAIRSPWEKRGWYAEAVAWIVSECNRLGYTPSGPVEQLKAAWSLSTILRVGTSAGALYFKADYAKPPSEPAIIAALARRWPRNVPEVIAADPGRGWMLMRDFGEHTLDHEPIAQWQAANRTFSAIQAACSADLEPWRRLGCVDLRIPVLTAQMERLLADPAALRIGEPDGLTVAEAARLRQLTPRLHDMWGVFGAIPVPASLVQQDFRHANIVLSEGTYLFYDWSDTVVSHPFFSCCRFLDFLADDTQERRRLISEAYLEPWTHAAGKGELQRAFALARRLNPVYVAIRWYLEAPYCEPASYWGRILRQRPATELRRFLAGMDVQ